MSGPFAATPVTVVVPVYDGFDEVVACLDSVLRHAATNTTEAGLLVVDDASPDPRVSTYLDELAARDDAWPVTLVRNDENLGFVRSANLAFARTEGDVVLLNADTVVTGGWLDRLADAARGDDVATVTPLTNEGSLSTLPASVIEAFDLDGEAPRIEECAEYVATRSAGERPEVISGVGFCMYVRREMLDRCGGFDEEAFGRGYGEEVDLCLRATRLGLRHLVEDSTYVHHHGGVSFGEEKAERLAQSSSLLRGRYRWFRATNRAERADDPLRVTFTSLELGLRERDPSRLHVLALLHGPPDNVGGTEKHLVALVESLYEDIDFSILYPVESGFVVRTCWNVGGSRPVEESFLLPGSVRWVTGTDDAVAREALEMALDLFPPDVVHLHNLLGHSLAPLDVLSTFAGPVVASVHDLFLTCPHYSLLYRDEQACGLPDDLGWCARCLPETEGLSVDFLEGFRADVAAHLDTVDRWLFASQSAADWFARVYPLDPDRVTIIEHGTLVGSGRPRVLDVEAISDEPLRLAFVGRGWPKKGLDTVNQLAEETAATAIEVHHFGELKGDASPHLLAHGPYDNALLADLLDRHGIQIVLLPGAYAETYGLVMSEALLAGRPVIGATFGALGQRIRADGVGWTFDPGDPTELRQLVERLDRCRAEVIRATRAAHAVSFPTVADTAPTYAALYRGATEDHERAEGDR
jgi:GT2 family glycosyltransferase/glycosyltransferase involved in cell wall biosynthesis